MTPYTCNQQNPKNGKQTLQRSDYVCATDKLQRGGQKRKWKPNNEKRFKNITSFKVWTLFGYGFKGTVKKHKLGYNRTDLNTNLISGYIKELLII